MFNEKMQQAKAFYELKNYGKALAIYEELKEIDQFQFERTCKFNYMWSLYRHIINPKEAFSDGNIDTTHEAVKYIMDHSDNSQLVYQFAVMKVLKYFEGKQNFEAEKINVWLDKLDPNLLSNDAHEYITDDGKKIIYVGNMEKWYALKSKATYELEMYKKCIDVSNEAQNTLRQLHNSNDLWFNRRIALSESALGNHDKALELFNLVLERKNDWFLYHELGDIYLRSEDEKSALSAYVKALNKPGRDEYKIKLYPKIAELVKSDDPDDEKALIDFAVKIKVNNEWKLDHNEKVHYDNNKDEIDNTGYSKLKDRVMNVAQRIQWSGKEKLYGKVSNILPNGKAGFIQSEDASYYFSFRSLSNAKNVDRGMNVSFFTEKGFDKKKNRETVNAVNIYVEE